MKSVPPSCAVIFLAGVHALCKLSTSACGCRKARFREYSSAGLRLSEPGLKVTRVSCVYCKELLSHLEKKMSFWCLSSWSFNWGGDFQ